MIVIFYGYRQALYISLRFCADMLLFGINMMNQQFKTPGQLIQALLTERDWSQRTLSIVLGMDETVVNRLCTDKRPMDAKLALA